MLFIFKGCKTSVKKIPLLRGNMHARSKSAHSLLVSVYSRPFLLYNDILDVLVQIKRENHFGGGEPSAYIVYINNVYNMYNAIWCS